jgi:hypothetical protein
MGYAARLREGQLSTKSTAKARPRSSRDKVRAHRERLRKRGLRPIQIWVPDVRSRRFKAEAHRQSLAIAKSSTEKEDQTFVDAISWWCDQE